MKTRHLPQISRRGRRPQANRSLDCGRRKRPAVSYQLAYKLGTLTSLLLLDHSVRSIHEDRSYHEPSWARVYPATIQPKGVLNNASHRRRYRASDKLISAET